MIHIGNFYRCDMGTNKNDIILSMVNEVDNIYIEKKEIEHLRGIGTCYVKNLFQWLYQNSQNNDFISPWHVFFNPYSIYYELERVLLKREINPEMYVIEKRENGLTYRDPWRTWLQYQTINELIDANNIISQEARKYLEGCGTFIISYGMIEVWSSLSHPNLFLNNIPDKFNVQNHQWEAHLMNKGEIISAISNTINLLRTYLNRECSILLCICPVPPKYSFFFKSIEYLDDLRVRSIREAINNLIENKKDIYYFSSYDFFKKIENRGCEIFQEDNRHLTPTVLDGSYRFLMKALKNDFQNYNSAFTINRFNDCGGKIGKITSTL